MKRLLPLRFLLLALAAVTISGCGKPADPKAAGAKPAGQAAAGPVMESVDQKVCYGIGYNIGSGISRDGVLALDEAALLAGLRDALGKVKPRLGETEIQAAFTALQQKMMAAAAAAGEKQLALGKEYLAKNKAKPGVKVTASGLQYEVLKSGTGPKPKASDTVKVHYHGTLIDGQVFDSSVQRGEPVEFAVTGVIHGWIEALQLMSVGDKWKLTIPSELGYGLGGKGSIPPNAVLVFEVELLGITH